MCVWFQKTAQKTDGWHDTAKHPRPRNETADRDIDENLKRAFDEIANEPVPDRFTDLLKQLKDKGAATPSSPDRSEEERSDD